MAKIFVVFVFCVIAIAIAMPGVRGIAKDPEAVNEWFEKLPGMKPKVTKLHFYFHDVISGKNPTALLVARPNLNSTLANNYGAVFVADDPLTVGPNPDSEKIGSAQGMYGQADMNEISFHMDFNFVFTKGKYKGSTLSLVGWNSIFHEYREMSIVGGSGIFRLARGIATAKTHSLSADGLNAVVEYHVIVLHY